MAATRTRKKTFWESDAAKEAAAKGSGKYLTGPEKAALVEDETVLEIVGVRYDESNQYQGNPAPRFVVTFLVPEGTSVTPGERFYGFAISDDGDSSRDNLLGALADYLDSDDVAPVIVQLVKYGQFVAIEKAA